MTVTGERQHRARRGGPRPTPRDPPCSGRVDRARVAVVLRLVVPEPERGRRPVRAGFGRGRRGRARGVCRSPHDLTWREACATRHFVHQKKLCIDMAKCAPDYVRLYKLRCLRVALARIGGEEAAHCVSASKHGWANPLDGNVGAGHVALWWLGESLGVDVELGCGTSRKNASTRRKPTSWDLAGQLHGLRDAVLSRFDGASEGRVGVASAEGNHRRVMQAGCRLAAPRRRRSAWSTA
jgi:hypothetical protein